MSTSTFSQHTTLIFFFSIALASGCPGTVPLDAGALDAGMTDSGTSQSIFAVSVIDFEPGDGAGFGAEDLPDVVLGPPVGGGLISGSIDVLSLGSAGVITLELERDIFNGPGPDFSVFENAFTFGVDQVFQEPGQVSVSSDGETFVSFPCDTADPELTGCAGRTPVTATPETMTHCPDDDGGDVFDLDDIALDRIRYIRILDMSTPDGSASENSAGFDLDAVANIIPSYCDEE